MTENIEKPPVTVDKYDFSEEKKLFREGTEKLKNGDYLNAILLYNRILERIASMRRQYYNYAEKLKSLKQFRAAVVYYNQIPLLKRSFFEVYYNKAIAHKMLGEYIKCIRTCDKALKLKGNSKNLIRLRNAATKLYKLEMKDKMLKEIRDLKKKENVEEGHIVTTINNVSDSELENIESIDIESEKGENGEFFGIPPIEELDDSEFQLFDEDIEDLSEESKDDEKKDNVDAELEDIEGL